MPNSAKANRINVKRCVFAEVVSDTSTAYTHSAIATFGAPMQVQITPTLATGTLYGGGVKTEDLSKVTGYEVQLELNKIPIEVRAKILDNDYTDGVLTEKSTDKPIDIAVGFELEETGDNRELVWFFKGKARPYAQTTKQTENNYNFSTDTVTIGFVPREYDGKLKAFGDTANSAFTSTAADAFLTTIPGGTLAS